MSPPCFAKLRLCPHHYYNTIYNTTQKASMQTLPRNSPCQLSHESAVFSFKSTSVTTEQWFIKYKSTWKSFSKRPPSASSFSCEICTDFYQVNIRITVPDISRSILDWINFGLLDSFYRNTIITSKNFYFWYQEFNCY